MRAWRWSVWALVAGCLAPWRALRQIDANAPFDGVAVAMGPAAWRDGRLDRRVCVQGRSATWPGDREVLAVVLVDGSGSVCLAGEREARCGRATVGEVHLREPADTWWAPRRLCAREAVGWARVDDP